MTDIIMLPLALTITGRMATVEQGSAAELGQSVGLLLDTRPGERRSVPGYGLPDQRGSLSESGARDIQDDIDDAIGAWEPRADPAEVTVEVVDGFTGSLRVAVTSTAAADDFDDDLQFATEEGA